jgi:hypothetical protein
MRGVTNKHHLALGRAVDAWSKAEGQVWFVFSMISRTQIDVAYSIMASFNGFRPQKELFERMVKLQRMEPELRKLLMDAIKEFGKLTPQRNKIIHGEWHTRRTKGRNITFRRGKTKHMRYDGWPGNDPQSAVLTIEMIDQFTADCKNLAARMADIWENPLMTKHFPLIL